MSSKSTVLLLDLKIQRNSNGLTRRTLDSIDLLINHDKQEVKWSPRNKGGFHARFEPAKTISSQDRVELELHSSFVNIGTFSNKKRTIHLPLQDLFSDNRGDQGEPLGQGKQEWSRTIEGMDIVMIVTDSMDSPIDQLIPTLKMIGDKCPRFRILIIGKTGVGKSSLINRAFGIKEALISEVLPGKADIHKELSSGENGRFVLHDSLGFEPGDDSYFELVREFITDRGQRESLKERLHAIWLCIATPATGGRVIETGTEKIFKLKEKGLLGNVPIIAVFTKFDKLVGQENRMLDDELCDRLDTEEIDRLTRQNALNTFNTNCIPPLIETCGEIPYKMVSSKSGYESMVSDLMQLTVELVANDVDIKASIMAAVSQRVNLRLKMSNTIAVGKYKYWVGLASSANFSERRLVECLDVIHMDIIATWNLRDKHKNLYAEEFRNLISNIVGDIQPNKKRPKVEGNLVASVAIFAAVAGVVAALAGPVAPIVLPIAGGIVLAKWAYDIYRTSSVTLGHLMGYIIDLTIIMQILFCLTEGEHETSRRLIKFALKFFQESNIKEDIHYRIHKHASQENIYVPGAQDTTLEEIEHILELYRIDLADTFKLRSRLGGINLEQDESWQ